MYCIAFDPPKNGPDDLSVECCRGQWTKNFGPDRNSPIAEMHSGKIDLFDLHLLSPTLCGIPAIRSDA